jgi:5''-3'' exonuclease (including N-terminal domain of PolI)
MFAGYQQGRPELPDDFVPQIILLHELLEKMKVAVFELDGYEADDLIGTLALRAVSHAEKRGSKTLKNADVEVVIVTGDRDMLQLVNDSVKVLMPLLGITKTALFDAKAVEEKYGVKPSQFIDYKALIGDASDGYPGVAGIGPKTAANLLKEYGSFENLYQNIPKLPEKIGLKLATDAEQAALAKKTCDN